MVFRVMNAAVYYTESHYLGILISRVLNNRYLISRYTLFVHLSYLFK